MLGLEAYVGRLIQQLQASMAEAKTAQATYEEKLAKIGELASEGIRSCASEILSHGRSEACKA